VLRSLKALPTMLRVGFSEAVAYRAEMLVWVLATTMPFISLVMWRAVSEGGAVLSNAGRSWGQGDFTTYFLSVFIVRQLISAWAAWEMNFEIRQGTLSMRLLRPIHPVLSYAMSNIAAMPMRIFVAVPVVVLLLVNGAAKDLPSDPLMWLLWLLSLLGGWLVTFLAQVAIGSLSLFMESSVKIMDLWLALFFVFSGYLYPLEFFPPAVRAVADWLPFRSQISVPVEIMVGKHELLEAAQLVARQWAWVGVLLVLGLTLWQSGLKRFQAYGG
jgi:ABC-2 type transport system permease protein